MITNAPVNLKNIADIRFIRRSIRELIDRVKLGRIRNVNHKEPDREVVESQVLVTVGGGE